MLLSGKLPAPNFSNHTTLDALQFAVLAEMHQTNFLEDYYARQDRCGMILGEWVKRTQEIIDDKQDTILVGLC